MALAAAQSGLHICILQAITTCSLTLAEATQHILLQLAHAGKARSWGEYLLLCLNVKQAVCKPERLCVLVACKLEPTCFKGGVALLLQLPCKPHQPTLLVMPGRCSCLAGTYPAIKFHGGRNLSSFLSMHSRPILLKPKRPKQGQSCYYVVSQPV